MVGETLLVALAGLGGAAVGGSATVLGQFLVQRGHLRAMERQAATDRRARIFEIEYQWLRETLGHLGNYQFVTVAKLANSDASSDTREAYKAALSHYLENIGAISRYHGLHAAVSAHMVAIEEFESSEEDRFGREVRRTWLDVLAASEALVEQGFQMGATAAPSRGSAPDPDRP